MHSFFTDWTNSIMEKNGFKHWVADHEVHLWKINICTKDFPVNFKLSENLAGEKHWIKALNLLFLQVHRKINSDYNAMSHSLQWHQWAVKHQISQKPDQKKNIGWNLPKHFSKEEGDSTTVVHDQSTLTFFSDSNKCEDAKIIRKRTWDPNVQRLQWPKIARCSIRY